MKTKIVETEIIHDHEREVNTALAELEADGNEIVYVQYAPIFATIGEGIGYKCTTMIVYENKRLETSAIPAKPDPELAAKE